MLDPFDDGGLLGGFEDPTEDFEADHAASGRIGGGVDLVQ